MGVLTILSIMQDSSARINFDFKFEFDFDFDIRPCYNLLVPLILLSLSVSGMVSVSEYSH